MTKKREINKKSKKSQKNWKKVLTNGRVSVRISERLEGAGVRALEIREFQKRI